MNYIEDLSLRAATKGYTITYTERSKPLGAKALDSPGYHYRTEAFGEEESDAAMARFVELKAKLKS